MATDETTQEITLKELKNALKSIKNNKSPGPDEIPIEVIKSAGHEMMEFLVKLLNTCWRCTKGLEQITDLPDLQKQGRPP
jgi:hypothetical protein